MQEKPNILMIFTDQQRWDTLASYGNTEIKTPNLDRLAQEGALFETAVTPCPLCMPARASVMTGKTNSALGCMENIYPRDVDNRETIAGILSGEGYHCQAIGKMHFSNTPYAESYGMDHMILSEETRGVRTASSQKSVVLDDYDKFLEEHHAWGWDKPTEIGYNEIKPLQAPLPKELHVTQWCGDRSVQWLQQERPKDKPFFLWTSFVKPHVPYDCPQHLLDLYDPESLEDPWTSSEDGCAEYPYFDSYREGKEFDLYSEKAIKRAKAYYYANITFIDEQVGRILDTLEQEGLAESTLVVFTSDHGDLMGDHHLWYKCFGFEGSLRVPLLVRWPKKIAEGTRYTGLASLLDLFPTLLSAAGVNDAQYKRPGKDLMTLLSGENQHEAVLSEVMFPPYTMCHVRTNRYKYLFYQNGGFEQLFNVEDDPKELRNLASNPAYADVKQEMKQWAETYIQKQGGEEFHLDAENHLRSEPYQAHRESQERPFSRMPWDLRLPPSFCKNPGHFYEDANADWLDVLIKNAF